jgi:hypothetical protein
MYVNNQATKLQSKVEMMAGSNQTHFYTCRAKGKGREGEMKRQTNSSCDIPLL